MFFVVCSADTFCLQTDSQVTFNIYLVIKIRKTGNKIKKTRRSIFQQCATIYISIYERFFLL